MGKLLADTFSVLQRIQGSLQQLPGAMYCLGRQTAHLTYRAWISGKAQRTSHLLWDGQKGTSKNNCKVKLKKMVFSARDQEKNNWKPSIDECTRLRTNTPNDQQDANKTVIHNFARWCPVETGPSPCNHQYQSWAKTVRCGENRDSTGKRTEAQRDETIHGRPMSPTGEGSLIDCREEFEYFKLEHPVRTRLKYREKSLDRQASV